MGQRRPVLIAGPTASGKSALALALAERDGGCVINADAAQVYACWRILTARPGDEDLARAPHRLYGHVACAGGRYSVGEWLPEVAAAIADARRTGLRPIVVGGTGLYLSTLTGGLSDIPAIPPEVRARSEAMLAAGELDRMLVRLRQEDPATYASIDRNNPMRVQRAWEVLVATGRGLSDWHAAPHVRVVPPESAVRIVLQPEPDMLNSRIDRRFRQMVEQGAVEEVRTFLRCGYDWSQPAGQVLGARSLQEYLRGDLGLDAAVAASVTATRQFAKRQRTWFRNRMADWTRIDPATDPLAAIPTD